MPKIRVELFLDPDQGGRESHYLICPKCGQKFVDLEYLQGMVIARFKCRRCGSYIKADLVGVE